MGDIEGLSNEEIKDLILDDLRDVNIDVGNLCIDIADGPKVSLRGEADSARQHSLILQTIMDIIGVEDIEDELIVLEGLDDGTEDAEGTANDLYDPEDSEAGTEDASQSIEDGVPYIPPTFPAYRETPKDNNGRRKTPK